jgi:hypothetical protein
MNSSPPLIPSSAAFLSKLKQMPRRVELRVSHRVPCRVRTSEKMDEPSLNAVGQTVNLSPAGLAVQLGRPIDAGTVVEVSLPHLDGTPMTLRGCVAHSRRVMSGTYEIGIRIEPSVPEQSFF